jgi:hypothetical protein
VRNHRSPRVAVDRLEPRKLFAVAGPFQSRGPGGGGAFFAPSFNPANSQELYASSDMSGLYHSTNTGAAWQIADFRQIQANRGSRVAFTSDANIRYTLNYDESNIVRPARSADGGMTWTDSPYWTNTIGDDAYSIHADPAATNRLLVSTYNALYLSTDSGATFTSKYSNANGLYIAGAFFDGANIYVGTSAGLLVSNNNGASFTLSTAPGLPAGGAIISLAGAKSGATTRLFVAMANAGDVYPGLLAEELDTSYLGLYSLDVGAASWTSRGAGVPATEYPHFVAMARNDITRVYAAGSSAAGAPIILKSTTGGASWSDTLITANNGNVATGWQGAGGDRSWGFGELVLDFTVAPSDPNTLAFTDYGYLHLSTDGGTTWRQAYVNPADQNAAGTPTPQQKPYRGVGFEDTSALWMTWADANNVVAGYTDIRGVRSTDGGSSWLFPTSLSSVGNTLYQISLRGSGANVVLYGAGSSVHDIYQSTYVTDARLDGSGVIVMSVDKGATWTTIHSFGNPVVYTALDPTNVNRMYASVVDNTVGGIYITNNLNAGAASTWTKLPSPARTEGHPYNVHVLNDGTLIATYSARRVGSLFTASSGVFVSTNNGQTWTDRTLIGPTGGFNGQPAMQWWTKDLTIDPTDPTQNTWYAGVRSGFGGDGNSNDRGGVYKTTDRGVSWTRLFQTEGVESATINPNDGGLYVCTTSAGLWFSANPDAASPTFTQLDYLFRQPARVFVNPNNAGEMWVASFGYGLAKVAVTGSVDTIPPQVDGATFNFEQAPLSVTIAFSEDVSTSLAKADFAIKNVTTNTTLDPANYTFTQNAALHTATLTFAAPLPDADWRLSLPAGAIADAAGNTLANAFDFDFFALAGDATRDRTVNFADLVILAQNYNLTGKTFSQGNFDYSSDGLIGFQDLVILAQRYNVSLAVPSAAVTPATTKPVTRAGKSSIGDLLA